ncbi:MAG: hypothetical protein WC533_02650 [Candidatus Pacearchaeota archaeon]
MKDKKLLIAIGIIIILAVALVYVTLIGPSLQGYIINKQLTAQEVVVKTIINQAETNGYVQLTDGERTIVLINYQPENQTQI